MSFWNKFINTKTAWFKARLITTLKTDYYSNTSFSKALEHTGSKDGSYWQFVYLSYLLEQRYHFYSRPRKFQILNSWEI